MPRRKPPEGFYTAKQAIARMHITQGMFYKYIDSGKIRRYKPDTRKQGFYNKSEIDTLAEREATFFDQKIATLEDATFSLATLKDMDGITELAQRLFHTTIDAPTRREWFMVEPRGNYVLKKKDGTIVAYLYLQPFKYHDRLAAYMRKEVRGWQITGDDILPFAAGSPREVMIGGIGSLNENPGYVTVLLRGVRQNLAILGSQGIIISHLYAYSDRVKGIAMCAQLGMQQWEPPRGKRCTFVLDVEKSSHFMFQPYKEALHQWEHYTSPLPQQHTDLPEGLVGWRAFSRLHGIGESTVQQAIASGRLPIIENGWIVGRAKVRGALDRSGRAKFYQLYHTNRHFIACPECPHEFS